MKFLLPNTIAFTSLLSATVALGPLATDMYLPTLPILENLFSASVANVQLTLSVFMVGIACFQLLYGPLTDRFGRKPVLLVGLFIFIISSYACFQAETIEQLTLFRFFQSFGICAAIVIPRAMVRDLFELEQAARQISRMGTIMGLAPAIAPILGGYIAIYYGWRGVFLFLGGYAIVISLVVIFLVEDSLKHKDLMALKPSRILSNYLELLKSTEFMGYAISAGLCFGGMFVFISGSSFVLINVIGIPTEQFGYYFGLVVSGFMMGTLLGPMMTKRFGLRRSLQVGSFVTFGGGLLIYGLAFGSYLHPLAIAVPMCLYNMGVGIVMPQCQAGAMAPFPEKAGAASAMTGFIVLGFSAFLGSLVAELYDGTRMPMVTIIFLLGIATMIFYHLTVFRNFAQSRSAQLSQD